MIKLNNIEKTLEYHELLMIKELKTIDNSSLPKGFTYVFWNNESCKTDWINIHLETGEFNSIKEANEIFHSYYDKFYDERSSRCLFIENNKGEKIATATISPANEYGYKCKSESMKFS